MTHWTMQELLSILARRPCVRCEIAVGDYTANNKGDQKEEQNKSWQIQCLQRHSSFKQQLNPAHGYAALRTGYLDGRCFRFRHNAAEWSILAKFPGPPHPYLGQGMRSRTCR